jgi:hypothetical protein
MASLGAAIVVKTGAMAGRIDDAEARDSNNARRAISPRHVQPLKLPNPASCAGSADS